MCVCLCVCVCVSLSHDVQPLSLSFVQPSLVAGTGQRHRKEFRTTSSELTVVTIEMGGWGQGVGPRGIDESILSG